jgi:hypothetical protein
MHRQDSPQDIVIFVAIGVALLALLPAKQASPAMTPPADGDSSAVPSPRSRDQLGAGVVPGV